MTGPLEPVRLIGEWLAFLFLIAKKRLGVQREVWLARGQRGPRSGRAAVDIVLSVRMHEPRAYGLKADAEILERALEGSRIVNGYGPLQELRAAFRVFVEEAPRRRFPTRKGSRQALLINIENAMHNLALIRGIDIVLCKNRYTFDLLSAYKQGGARYRFLGLSRAAGDALIREGSTRVSEFDYVRSLLSRGGMDPASLTFELVLTRFTSPRILAEEEVLELIDSAPFDRIVHFASSRHKNTVRVLETYLGDPTLPELTVVSSISDSLEKALGRPAWRSLCAGEIQNVRIIEGPVSAEAHRDLFRSHRIHLCPSSAEGYGHYINEARAAGCLVITTAAPPMNELVTEDFGYLVAVSERELIGSFGAFAVTFKPESLAKTLRRLTEDSPEMKKERALRGLAAFHHDTEFFNRAMRELGTRMKEAHGG